MKKILIEKTRDQKKRKKSNGEGKTILKIIAGIVIGCAVLFCAVLMGMDALMRSVAPDIYLGGRLLNTYQLLEREQKQNGGFFTGEALPKGDLDAEVSGDFEKIGFALNGGFNKDSKKTYLKGEVDTFKGRYTAEFFHNNGTSGICLPDFLDVWLCTQNGRLFDDMQSTGVSEKLGIPALPSTDLGNVSLDLGSMFPSIKAMFSDIKISGYSKKGNGLSEYTVSLNGEAVKNTLVSASDIVWKESFKNDASDMNLLRSYIEEIPFPQEVHFKIHERKKAIVYASSEFNKDGEGLEIHMDISKNARLSDSIELRLLHTMDGESYGFTYTNNGDHANPKGKFFDNTELQVMLPFVKNISLKRDITFNDKKNFTYTLSAISNDTFELTLNGNGTYTASKFSAIADSVVLKTKDTQHTGKGSIKFTPKSADFEIPQREQFDLGTIPEDTLKQLTDGISLFLR